MEYVFEKLKSFILSDVNAELSQLEDETTTLPLITADQIVFGTVDIAKNQHKIICAIVPESQDEMEDDISDYCEESTLTISFLFRGDIYNNLIKKMCRYTCAFRNALLKDTSLNGSVQDAQIGNRQFFPNCGTTDFTMTASEVELTVITCTEVI